jgi:hypothetical protein
MQFIGATKNFSFLAQESFLAKNCILSGFDSLLAANYFCAKDGYFYTAFFNLSIGLERIMKLVIVADYMLKNNMNTPSEQYLRGFGHKIDVLYQKICEMSSYYGNGFGYPEVDSNPEILLAFLSKFGSSSRYYNLNEIASTSGNISPLDEWKEIALELYLSHTASHIREANSTKIFSDMDRSGEINSYTRYLDTNANPLMLGDIRYLQMVTAKAAPLAIWELIALFRPVHFMLEKMAAQGQGAGGDAGGLTIPHFEEFFYFLLAMLPDVKRRKRWLQSFTN